MYTHELPLEDTDGNRVGSARIYVDIKKNVDQAHQAKEIFLHNIHHDLITPFSGILTLSELMVEDEQDSEKRSLLQAIADSSNVLLKYINQVLEHTKLETQGIILKSINVKNALNDAAVAVMPVVKIKKLTLQENYAKNIPDNVIGDVWRLQRILVHLVGNAVKFTEHGAITIRADVLSETPEKVTLSISVEDTGIGIPTEKHQAIFEKFTRLEPAYTGNYSGAGLGLYEVKKLCEELNGSITVTSEVGKGSMFNCILPFIKIVDGQR